MSITLLVLYSFQNLGDKTHAELVAERLSEKYAPQTTLKVDAKESEQVAKAFDSIKDEKDKVIIISAGDIALKVIHDLQNKELLPINTYIYSGLHQYYTSLLDETDVLKVVDTLALPKSAISHAQKETLRRKNHLNVVETFAVPSVKDSQNYVNSLKDSYEKWNQKDQIKIEASNLFVTIPGDAPDVDGKMKFFDHNSAESLVRNIISLNNKHKFHSIILQNGPRTGKHDPKTGKEICNHEYREGQEIPIDHISKYVLDKLKENNLPVKLFNFSFFVDNSKKTANSVYNQLLYAAHISKDSIVFLPGESVSDIGKLPLIIEPERLIAFQPSSMNESHKKLLNDGFERGYYSIIDGSQILKPEKFNKRVADDSEVIVERIFNELSKEQTHSKMNSASSQAAVGF